MQKVKERPNGLIWGLLLVAAGVLFLLQNMGLSLNFGGILAMLLFGGGGLVFLFTFLTDFRGRWWAAIPGMTLMGLAATVFFDNYAPSFLDGLGGPIFLAAIGAGFILVYLSDLTKWWALIPAGVMTTLGVVAAVDELRFLGIDSGGVFFVGLGLTFLIVAFFTGQRGERQSWAFIPAAVLIIMGILIGTPWLGYLTNLWPLALIIVGASWILRSVAGRKERFPVTHDEDRRDLDL